MKTNEFIESNHCNPDLIDAEGNVYTYWDVQKCIRDAINTPDTDEVQEFYYEGTTADYEEVLRHIDPLTHMQLVLKTAFDRYEKWEPNHRWIK